MPQTYLNDGAGNMGVGNNLKFLTDKAGIAGTVLATSANAGIVGEVMWSKLISGSGLAFTNSVTRVILFLALTAGDWDISGNLNIQLTSATIAANQYAIAGINTATNLVTTDGTEIYLPTPTLASASTFLSLVIPPKQISIASTTTYNLVGALPFSAGTAVGYGSLFARRRR